MPERLPILLREYFATCSEYLCNLQYDAGKFGDQGSHRPRYFYSKSFKNCMLFTYYGRDGNANNFETYNECKAMCMS
ncbi:Kunitz/Bovine pancreatic trypsin inhibitor domain protein [Ancylostoma duodenale]|uniref:Kunitz/Bovine pancreatic trypsin inhibitor domain protein n=1 Tax=Ancylostoma duodenale TaxID=51022 RepID=A0A0C2GGD6_9BILA|nr:Kunitz/Bovine pancreatic trypsin inhibitor domain protein [Ancylostoma duodenale]